jgi:bile-acid 7alpha-dehydratase
MTESAETEARVKRIEEMDAIKRLKYKYVRCVDSKLWDDLAQCFVQEATTSYGGKYNFAGLAAIMDFLRKYNPPEVITMHHVHHPEIEMTGGDTARATWALEDYVISLKGDWSHHGTAFYHDEYVKVDGQWKIRHTGYQRVFSERWTRSEIKSLKLTENMHASPQK